MPEEHKKWRESILEGSTLNDFRSIVSLETPDLNADLDLLLEHLQCTGINEIITVDLTKPELKIPVARIIIPGMEGKLAKTETLLGQRAGRILGQESTP
jgi:ribosomal protein S12 methylthiotransferase accessory factor YcaO